MGSSPSCFRPSKFCWHWTLVEERLFFVPRAEKRCDLFAVPLCYTPKLRSLRNRLLRHDEPCTKYPIGHRLFPDCVHVDGVVPGRKRVAKGER